MATATTTMTQDEAQRLSGARKQLTDAERALKQTEAQITEESDKLADLQAQRTSECELLALGRRADTSKFDADIHATQDKLAGLGAVRRTRERSVADARANYHNLSAEQGRAETERLRQKEGEDVKRLISQVEDAIQTRDRAAKTVVEGIASLRAWKYMAEPHRRLGVDSAQRLERISNGMRP
jgi:hypothetical protein